MSIFDKSNHKFMRNILILASFTSSVLCIWVFGNADYFPEKLLEAQRYNSFVITSSANSTSESFYFEKDPTTENSISRADFNALIQYTKFESIPSSSLLDKYPNYHSEMASGDYWYFNLFAERTNNSSLAKVIIFIILSFLMIQILRYFYKKFQKYFQKRAVKKGIGFFKDHTPNTLFEDLMADEEILDIETMWRLMKGRETNLKRLISLHDERVVRLKRVWRRRSKRNTLRRSNSLRSGAAAKRQILRFKSLASYDFKVRFRFVLYCLLDPF